MFADIATVLCGRMAKRTSMDGAAHPVLTSGTPPAKKIADEHSRRDHNDNTLSVSASPAVLQLDGHRKYVDVSSMHSRVPGVSRTAPKRQDVSQDFTQFKLPVVVSGECLLADVRNGPRTVAKTDSVAPFTEIRPARTASVSKPEYPVATVGGMVYFPTVPVRHDVDCQYRGPAIATKTSSASEGSVIGSDRLGSTPDLAEFRPDESPSALKVDEPASKRTPPASALITSVTGELSNNSSSVTPLDILSSVACAEQKRLVSSSASVIQSCSGSPQIDRTQSTDAGQSFQGVSISANISSTCSVPLSHVSQQSSSVPVCQMLKSSDLLAAKPLCSVNANERSVSVHQPNLPPFYMSSGLPPVCGPITTVSPMPQLNNNALFPFVALPKAMTLPVTTYTTAGLVLSSQPCSPSTMTSSVGAPRSCTNEVPRREFRPLVIKSELHKKRGKGKTARSAGSPARVQTAVPPEQGRYVGGVIKPEILAREQVGMPLACSPVPVPSKERAFLPNTQQQSTFASPFTMVSLQPSLMEGFPQRLHFKDNQVYNSFRVSSFGQNATVGKLSAVGNNHNFRPQTPTSANKQNTSAANTLKKIDDTCPSNMSLQANSMISSSTVSVGRCEGFEKQSCVGLDPKSRDSVITQSVSTSMCIEKMTSVANRIHLEKNPHGNNCLQTAHCIDTAVPFKACANGLSITSKSSFTTVNSLLCQPTNTPASSLDQPHLTSAAGSAVSNHLLCQSNITAMNTSTTAVRLPLCSHPESNFSVYYKDLSPSCSSKQNVTRKSQNKSGAALNGSRKRKLYKPSAGEKTSSTKWAKRRRPNDAVIVCNLCQHTVNYNLEWKRHVKEKHWDLVKSFSCKECFIPFESKAAFLNHLEEEHPKMLPFRLLPEKMFCTMMEELKHYKKKSYSDQNCLSTGDQQSQTANPKLKAEHLMFNQESLPAVETIDQQSNHSAQTVLEPETTQQINASQEKESSEEEVPQSRYHELVTSPISSPERTDRENTVELPFGRTAAMEESATFQTSGADSEVVWQSDNDNASTKSYAESPDRNISDSEIPPSAAEDQSKVDGVECQLLYWEYPADPQSLTSLDACEFQPPDTESCLPKFTEYSKTYDAPQTKDVKQPEEISSAHGVCLKSEQDKISKTSTLFSKKCIEVGNSRRKLNIRPGLLDARLRNKRFRKRQRRNAFGNSSVFSHSNNIKKKQRSLKVSTQYNVLDDATLPDLDLPSKECRTDDGLGTNTTGDQCRIPGECQPPELDGAMSTVVSELPSPLSCTEEQTSTNSGMHAAGRNDVGVSVIDRHCVDDESAEVNDHNDCQPANCVLVDGGSESVLGQLNFGSSGKKDSGQTEVLSEGARPCSRTSPLDSSFEQTLSSCKGCFVKLERIPVIDHLKRSTFRIVADGQHFAIEDDATAQTSVHKAPCLERASVDVNGAECAFAEENAKNNVVLRMNEKINPSLPSDFTCDQRVGDVWGCMLCTFSNVEYDSVRQHVRSEHIAAKRFFCPKCSLSSHEYHDIENHVLYEHRDVTAVVLSRRCPHESELASALCLWLPREMKWKNTKLKLEKVARMSGFVRSRLNFNDSKRYTCYVCSKQIRGVVLIRRHVAAYWKLANGTGAGSREILTDDDNLKGLFDRRCRVIPKRHTSSSKDVISGTERELVKSTSEDSSDGTSRRVSKFRTRSSAKGFSNAVDGAGVQSSSYSLSGDDTTNACGRPVISVTQTSRSVWTTLENISHDMCCQSPDDSCAVSVNSSKLPNTTASGLNGAVSGEMLAASSNSERRHTAPGLCSSSADRIAVSLTVERALVSFTQKRA